MRRKALNINTASFNEAVYLCILLFGFFLTFGSSLLELFDAASSPIL